MVTFRYLNLVDDVYPSLLTNTVGMDLILCRNVLIYFRRETIARVVERLHRALAPDGWLLVGNAEPMQAIAAPLFISQSYPGMVAHRPANGSAAEPFGPAERSGGEETWSVPAIPPPAEEWVVPRPSSAKARPSSAKARPSRRKGAAPAGGSRAEPVAPPELDGQVERLKSKAEADPTDAVAAYQVAKMCASRLELDAAEYWVGVAIARDPMLAKAHYLHGIIFQERGLSEPALVALRRSVCADAQFVLGHFALGTLLRGRGQTARARKAFDNVAALLSGRDPNELVPEGDGLTVGRLVELVNLQETTTGEVKR
jgi:chemotaxis protein methyltransferase CheR